MSKFQKGDVVYRACIAEFEGAERAFVMLSCVAAVCPQREGPPKYILHNFDAARGTGMVRSSHNALEDALFVDPLEAMVCAVSALRAISAALAEPAEVANG